MESDDVKKIRLLHNVPLPYLTVDERRLPKPLRKLIITSKRCSDSNKFDLVTPTYLSELFQDGEDYMPRFAPSPNEKFFPAQYSYGESCANFHIHWAKQEPRIEFMKSWLTASVKSGDLPLTDAFKKIQLGNLREYEGKMVVVQWMADKCWYRGLVVKVEQNSFLARVYYIDQGNVEIQSAETLRIIPEELTKIPPMAFRASLADTNLSSEEEALAYGRTQFEFMLKLKNLANFWCRIRRIIMNADSHVGDVSRLSGIRFGLDQAVVILSDPIPKNDSGSGLENSKWQTLNEIVRNNMGHELFVGPVKFHLDEPLPDEIKVLTKCHPSSEIVTHARTPSFKDPTMYRIVHAVHPHLFFIEEATETALERFKENDSKMQDFYCNFGPNFEDYIIRTRRVFQGRHYVWRRHENKHWYRARVVRVSVPRGKCYIHLVDIGKELLVNVHDMMELKSEYSLPPARAMRVHLAHTKPILSVESECVWPESTTTEFRKLAKEAPHFYGIALEKKMMTNEDNCTLSISEGPQEKIMSAGVLLIDTNFRNGYSLQARLRLMGMVQSDGFATGTNHLAFLCYEGIPSYSREAMLASVQSELQQMGILNLPKEWSKCKPSPASLTIDSHFDTNAVDYFTGDPNIQPMYEERGIRRNLPLLHPCNCLTSCVDPDHAKNTDYSLKLISSSRPKIRYLRKVGNLPAVRRNYGQLTKVFGKYIGSVRISHVVGPGVFYIQMQNKIDELHLLMESISTVIENYSTCTADTIQNDDFYVGSLIAVYIENEIEKKMTWHRAFIYKLLSDKSIAKVILTDFGGLINVRFENMRVLPEYFWGIPAYCHRAHLDFQSSMALRNNRWTARMNEIFKDFVTLDTESIFLASKTRPSPNDEIKVADYGQDVFFEADKKQWYAGGDLIDYPIIPTDKDSRNLLYHLLHSYGVNLWWENPGDEMDKDGNVGHKFESVECLFL